jgi:hypothetical protein
MILGNGRAIFHEKRAKRSRQGDSNPRRRKRRATGDSGGAGPIPGGRGKPRFTRVGRGSGSAGRPELQGPRIGEPDATGNRGGHGTERRAKDAGQPVFRASRTGEARAAGNRGPRATGNEPPAATGNRSCRRVDESEVVPGDRRHQTSGNEFREAPGNRSFRGASGNRGSEKSAGNRRFQSTAGRLAQGNDDGTRTGSGGASSQASGDGDTGKLSSGSRSQIFEEFGQKGARSCKGPRPLRFWTEAVSSARQCMALALPRLRRWQTRAPDSTAA